MLAHHVTGTRERFDRLNAALLPQLSALVKQWLPRGGSAGSEWTALNPHRHDRRPGSFRVNMRTGRWADFANGERGGDPVSLYAYLFTNGRQGTAAGELESGGMPVSQRCPAKVAKAANPNADEERRIARACSTYTAARPIGGAAGVYLSSRGLHPVPAWKVLRAAILPYPHAGKRSHRGTEDRAFGGAGRDRAARA